MAAGWSSENSILMLQADQVDITEVKKVRSRVIGRRVAFHQFEAHARGIVVVRAGIVDWHSQKLDGLVFRGDGVA